MTIASLLSPQELQLVEECREHAQAKLDRELKRHRDLARRRTRRSTAERLQRALDARLAAVRLKVSDQEQEEGRS